MLMDNDFSGPIPSSWGALPVLASAGLYQNPLLSGCLPGEWHARPNVVSVIYSTPALGGSLYLEGTGLTGFCINSLETLVGDMEYANEGCLHGVPSYFAWNAYPAIFDLNMSAFTFMTPW